MARIFVSYRRDDTAGVTGRLYDRLEDHFGREAVFRDIDTIPAGGDFRESIERALDNADAIVCVIGDNWVSTTAGVNRMMEPTDFVRLELESALRKSIPIIPILVDDATMPGADELPVSLHDIRFRNAMPLSQLRDFDVHAKRIIDSLDRSLTHRLRVVQLSRVSTYLRIRTYSVMAAVVGAALIGFALFSERVKVDAGGFALFAGLALAPFVLFALHRFLPKISAFLSIAYGAALASTLWIFLSTSMPKNLGEFLLIFSLLVLISAISIFGVSSLIARSLAKVPKGTQLSSSASARAGK